MHWNFSAAQSIILPRCQNVTDDWRDLVASWFLRLTNPLGNQFDINSKMSGSCYDRTVLITCWWVQITQTNDDSVRRCRAFILMLHSPSLSPAMEMDGKLPTILHQYSVFSDQKGRGHMDSRIAGFYCFLIKLLLPFPISSFTVSFHHKM